MEKFNGFLPSCTGCLVSVPSADPRLSITLGSFLRGLEAEVRVLFFPVKWYTAELLPKLMCVNGRALLSHTPTNAYVPLLSGGHQDAEVYHEVLRLRLPSGWHDQGPRCGNARDMPDR